MYNVFHNCSSLIEATVPVGVTSLDNYAFRRCFALETVEILGQLTTISVQVFDSCYNINITLPSSLTSIGNVAFLNCRYGVVTILATTPPSLGNNVFTSGVTIYVPSEVVDTYKAAWPDYANYINAIQE